MDHSQDPPSGIQPYFENKSDHSQEEEEEVPEEEEEEAPMDKAWDYKPASSLAAVEAPEGLNPRHICVRLPRSDI